MSSTRISIEVPQEEYQELISYRERYQEILAKEELTKFLSVLQEMLVLELTKYAIDKKGDFPPFTRHILQEARTNNEAGYQEYIRRTYEAVRIGEKEEEKALEYPQLSTEEKTERLNKFRREIKHMVSTPGNKNAWLSFESMEVYIRHSHKYFQGSNQLCIQIANMNIPDKGLHRQGVLTRLILTLVQETTLPIYMENTRKDLARHLVTNKGWLLVSETEENMDIVLVS